jgi:aspartyl-tRNA(Asn)/glutamyl-tRNA(Gln) amidotransferase subunit A
VTVAAVVSSDARAIVDAALTRASALEDLGAFWTVDRVLAGRVASSVGARVARGEHVPLAGLPVAVKACIDVAGLPTSVGVDGAETVARANALVVGRLLRAGGVPVGKTAMDQLGWATAGVAPGRRAVMNPRSRAHSPGGSSAGSAVAVAAGIVPVALGTDTAGSVRVPASYCGIVGLKPASRALPRAGCVRIAPTFEVPGLLAVSVGACRRAYEALTGRSVAGVRGSLRVGRLDDLFDAADPIVAGACRDALQALTSRHAVLPARLEWRPARFGRALAADLADTWGARIARDPDLFTDSVRESAELGRRIGEGERREILTTFEVARDRLRDRLGSFDVLACPTVPHPVPRVGDVSVAEATRFTRAFNALGWPAISIPCGSDRDGMPIGLQLAALPSRLGQMLFAAEEISASIGFRA